MTPAKWKDPSVEDQVQAALTALEKMSTRRDRENLSRFGIAAPEAFGVSVGNIQKLAKRLGRNHGLAVALWKTGWYEARMLKTGARSCR
jgi:3-methyladenine DNA glycosylase AlkD